MGAPAGLEVRQAGGSCSAVQLVFAAGTGEMGFGTVGAPLARALATAIPGTTAHAIPYSTIAEYMMTVQSGGSMATQYVTAQAARCPSQKFILSGYSKGALVVHYTTLNPAVKSKVVSILVFGDPLRNIGGAWPINMPKLNKSPRAGNNGENIGSFCNAGDMFCNPPGTIFPHIAYPMDGSIQAAARFAAKAAGATTQGGGASIMKPMS